MGEKPLLRARTLFRQVAFREEVQESRKEGDPAIHRHKIPQDRSIYAALSPQKDRGRKGGDNFYVELKVFRRTEHPQRVEFGKRFVQRFRTAARKPRADAEDVVYEDRRKHGKKAKPDLPKVFQAEADHAPKSGQERGGKKGSVAEQKAHVLPKDAKFREGLPHEPIGDENGEGATERADIGDRLPPCAAVFGEEERCQKDHDGADVIGGV